MRRDSRSERIEGGGETRHSRVRRWLARVAAVVSGIALALVVAEAGASWARDGAFPYLTCFVADAEVGVRLAPSAVRRVRSRGGDVTTVTTGSHGYRGREWSASAGLRVVILGDSQAMGLHVQDDETIAAHLDHSPGVDAWSLGVPTWGPHEAARSLADEGPALSPTHAIFLVNVANDWHEAEVPNRARTTARDGWAVRPGAAEHTSLLAQGPLARSHLVYALRVAMGRAHQSAPLVGESPTRVVRDLPWLRRAPTGSHSRVGPALREAQAHCARLGCELIVAVLPMDVEVHAREWAKYRTAPVDVRAVRALTEGALADARELGVRGIDLLPALRAASPGAFRYDDPHLSARGHAAAAGALLAQLLDQPPAEHARAAPASPEQLACAHWENQR